MDNVLKNINFYRTRKNRIDEQKKEEKNIRVYTITNPNILFHMRHL